MATIQMAANYAKGSTFILGEPQTGRSTWAIEALKGKKVLWVSFNNIGTVSAADTFGEGSKLVLVNEYADIPTITKDDGYEAVVLDGLNYMTGIWFTQNVGSKQPTQQDWGKLSNDMSGLVLRMRKFAPVFCIVDIEISAEGVKQVALNRASYLNIVGLFDEKVRTFLKMEVKAAVKDGKQSVEKTVKHYTVTGAEALDIPQS